MCAGQSLQCGWEGKGGEGRVREGGKEEGEGRKGRRVRRRGGRERMEDEGGRKVGVEVKKGGRV